MLHRLQFLDRFFESVAQWDRLLLGTVLLLAAFGLIMVYSASFIYAQERTGDGWYFIWRQCLYMVAGLVAMGFGYHQPAERWKHWVYPIFGFVILLLILVQIPGIGARVGGAQRWIRLGWMSIQPGELAKYAAVLWFSNHLAKKHTRLQQLGPLLFAPIAVLGPLFLLLLKQPDFGTTALIILVLLLMAYLAGVSAKRVLVFIGVGLGAAAFLVMTSSYRKERVLTYLDPWADPSGSGFQVIQSLVAFFQGGLLGAGLGNSKEKLLFLPEAHNDFIFAVVGEELGFIGVLMVIATFLFFVFRGLKIASAAFETNKQMGLFAAGITLTIGIQAFLNMAVAMGLLPTKGMNLPFVSYGGSALLVQFFAVGVLLRISHTALRSKS